MVDLSSQFGGPYFTRGGQGKFFRDPKPINQHRYQAGYTPDRMSAIKQSMIDVNAGLEGHFAGPAGAHRALQVIARSKTPVREFNEAPVKVAVQRTGMSDPSGVDRSDLWPLHIQVAQEAVLGSGKRGSGAAAGNYSGGGDWERGNINIGAHHHDTEEQAGQSLIHELGHYKSAKVDNSGHQAWYGRDPAETGREEARADDNMVKRWRPDPRDVRKGTSNPKQPTYEWSGAFHGMGGRKAHGPYLTARTTIPKADKAYMRETGQRKPKAGEMYSSLKPFVTEHDQALHQFDRHSGKWMAQHPLFTDRRTD